MYVLSETDFLLCFSSLDISQDLHSGHSTDPLHQKCGDAKSRPSPVPSEL